MVRTQSSGSDSDTFDLQFTRFDIVAIIRQVFCFSLPEADEIALLLAVHAEQAEERSPSLAVSAKHVDISRFSGL